MNRYKTKGIILLLGMLCFLAVGTLNAKSLTTNGKNGLQKPSAAKCVRTLSNIGNWGYWIYYDGTMGITPGNTSGCFYPRGTAGAVFQDGFVFAGYVSQNGVRLPERPLRCGGVTYSTGTTPGWIQADGTPISPDEYRARLYRIRVDWETLTRAQVKQDAAEINLVPISAVTDAQCDEVIAQYKLDWEEWPVDLGAPYVDVNANGVWDVGVDKPGIALADQVVWLVINDKDESRVLDLYGSRSIGLELQITLWGYNQPSAALGQLVFKKVKIINKSQYDIDSMFVSQWCDPDLGEAGDDFVGCDTTLSLGYVYNGQSTDANYAPFGIAPPAVGYDFFQGPIVTGIAGQDLNKNGVDDASDYAIFDLKKVGPGKINLPMTSFAYFSAGSAISDPPLKIYDGTLQWYNMIRGFTPTNDITNYTPYIAGAGLGAGQPTIFPLSGDPVANTGDVDGQGTNFAYGDRRMFQSSGPFTMTRGDTQEVVVALVGGLGGDNLSSISALKSTDDVAQKLYNDLFSTVPKAPATPSVNATPTEDVIVLNWGDNQTLVAETEKNNSLTGYNFQGYNIYQLPSVSASLDQGVRIVTFDLVDDVTIITGKRFVSAYGQVVEVPVQYGSDKGVQRYFVIDKDYLTGTPLYPGNTYYFVVTAYNYNPAPALIEDKALESGQVVVAVVPQSTTPGVRIGGDIQSSITVNHPAGRSDGVVTATVIDPLALKDYEYKVTFALDQDTISSTYGQYLWNMKNMTLGTVLMPKGVYQADDVANATDHPIVDGVQVRVSGPATGMKNWSYVPAANRWLTWSAGDLWGLEGYSGSIGWGNNFFGSNLPADRLVNVELRFTATDATGIPLDPQNVNVSNAYRYLRRAAVAAAQPEFAPFIINPGAGYAYQDMPPICLSAWDVENNRRLAVGFMENNAAGALVNGRWFPGRYDTEGGTNVVRDILFIFASDYKDTPQEAYKVDFLAQCVNMDLMWVVTCSRRGAVVPKNGDVLNILANHINTDADEFTFTVTGTGESLDSAKEDVKKITIFPNPYYAYNTEESNRFDRFVTFCHLPKKATIRIFNLAGLQVRKLEKDDNTQFYKWDLMNENNLQIASGLYVAYIDMPELGETKMLKIMIIQGEQILDTY